MGLGCHRNSKARTWNELVQKGNHEQVLENLDKNQWFRNLFCVRDSLGFMLFLSPATIKPASGVRWTKWRITWHISRCVKQYIKVRSFVHLKWPPSQVARVSKSRSNSQDKKHGAGKRSQSGSPHRKRKTVYNRRAERGCNLLAYQFLYVMWVCLKTVTWSRDAGTNLGHNDDNDDDDDERQETSVPMNKMKMIITTKQRSNISALGGSGHDHGKHRLHLGGRWVCGRL